MEQTSYGCNNSGSWTPSYAAILGLIGSQPRGLQPIKLFRYSDVIVYLNKNAVSIGNGKFCRNLMILDCCTGDFSILKWLYVRNLIQEYYIWEYVLTFENTATFGWWSSTPVKIHNVCN